jgi:small subunit ribosomal protein S17
VPKTETTTETSQTAPGDGRGRGYPKTRDGVVTSTKMQKTVVVKVERHVKHQRYGKYVTRQVKYKAHDETSKLQVGDRVRIAETRPMSKDKRWRVIATLQKANQV